MSEAHKKAVSNSHDSVTDLTLSETGTGVVTWTGVTTTTGRDAEYLVNITEKLNAGWIFSWVDNSSSATFIRHTDDLVTWVQS